MLKKKFIQPNWRTQKMREKEYKEKILEELKKLDYPEEFQDSVEYQQYQEFIKK